MAIWVSQVGAGRWSLGAVVLLVVGQHRENLAAHAAPEQPLCLEHARDSHLNHSSSTETEIVLVFTSATKYQLRIDFMYHRPNGEDAANVLRTGHRLAIKFRKVRQRCQPEPVKMTIQ